MAAVREAKRTWSPHANRIIDKRQQEMKRSRAPEAPNKYICLFVCIPSAFS